MSFIARLRAWCSSMTLGGLSDTYNANATVDADPPATEDGYTTPQPKASAGGKAPRKALAVKKERVAKGPARPYKKQDDQTMKTRIETMKRKIELLKSKAVILQDRLTLHEAEMTYRQDSK